MILEAEMFVFFLAEPHTYWNKASKMHTFLNSIFGIPSFLPQMLKLKTPFQSLFFIESHTSRSLRRIFFILSKKNHHKTGCVGKT
jgi:hypothetical protein